MSRSQLSGESEHRGPGRGEELRSHQGPRAAGQALRSGPVRDRPLGTLRLVEDSECWQAQGRRRQRQVSPDEAEEGWGPSPGLQGRRCPQRTNWRDEG